MVRWRRDMPVTLCPKEDTSPRSAGGLRRENALALRLLWLEEENRVKITGVATRHEKVQTIVNLAHSTA